MIPRGNKFVRRHDLTASLRLYIAFMALTARAMGTWGKITELSRRNRSLPPLFLPWDYGRSEAFSTKGYRLSNILARDLDCATCMFQ